MVPVQSCSRQCPRDPRLYCTQQTLPLLQRSVCLSAYPSVCVCVWPCLVCRFLPSICYVWDLETGEASGKCFKQVYLVNIPSECQLTSLLYYRLRHFRFRVLCVLNTSVPAAPLGNSKLIMTETRLVKPNTHLLNLNYSFRLFKYVYLKLNLGFKTAEFFHILR